jgi:geranylgeranylglycerol-phosphate geranylgeranyltransferase
MSILLIAYPLFMNRVKYLGNFIVSLGTGITFIYGAAAVGTMPQMVGFLAAAAFLANLGREITKDIEDLNKDAGEKRTLPMLLGKTFAKIFVILYYFLAVLAAFSASWMFNLNSYFNLFTIVSAIIFLFSIIVLVKGDAKKSQKFSKVAMLMSLIAFVLALI